MQLSITNRGPTCDRRRGLYFGIRALSLATLVGLVLLSLLGGTTLNKELARSCPLPDDTEPGVKRLPELGCVGAAAPIVLVQVAAASVVAILRTIVVQSPRCSRARACADALPR